MTGGGRGGRNRGGRRERLERQNKDVGENVTEEER